MLIKEACLKQSEKRLNQGFADHGGFCDFFDDTLAILLTTYDYIIMFLETL